MLRIHEIRELSPTGRADAAAVEDDSWGAVKELYREEDVP